MLEPSQRILKYMKYEDNGDTTCINEYIGTKRSNNANKDSISLNRLFTKKIISSWF